MCWHVDVRINTSACSADRCTRLNNVGLCAVGIKYGMLWISHLAVRLISTTVGDAAAGLHCMQPPCRRFRHALSTLRAHALAFRRARRIVVRRPLRHAVRHWDGCSAHSGAQRTCTARPPHAHAHALCMPFTSMLRVLAAVARQTLHAALHCRLVVAASCADRYCNKLHSFCKLTAMHKQGQACATCREQVHSLGRRIEGSRARHPKGPAAARQGTYRYVNALRLTVCQ